MFHRISGLIPVAVILIVVAPAAHAADGAQVVAASGDLKNWVQSQVSPTPGFCEWTAPVGLTSFSATSPDGNGTNGCPFPWAVHCDDDSLSYNASFPKFEADFLASVSYEAALACRVTFTRETVVVADRSASGELATDEHTVTLVYPNGAEVPLLTAGSGPNQGRAFVKPGTYEIRLLAHALEDAQGGEVLGYKGRVAVVWRENVTVGTEPMAWGQLKATYGP